jgi:hypothetical protein
MSDTKDQQLWRLARNRANFRRNLYSYIVVNTFLWLIWWFTTGKITGFNGYPWPVWVMFGWGVSIAFQYYKGYKGAKDLEDDEYEKLKRQQRE